MLGNQHDAEDVVHDALLRALRAIGQCRTPERFRAWLFQIQANACRTALLQRRRRTGWFRSDGGDEIAQLADSGMVANAGLEEQRQARLATALQHALLRLDVKQREAFLLKYGEGMEYTEMAAVTGVGVSALKMRVKRACEALRPLLAEVVHDL
jgi:RNA polymerase sigma-70 factor (ECF subfamily)